MNPDDSSLLGWDEGVMEMTLGEKSVLTIPG
jgi:FKBP-type peptidyl-prolyl cis-trans isomerase